jgi:SRSO17 transposase
MMRPWNRASPEIVREAAGRLDELARPFLPLFGRTEARAHARTYLKGLLAGPSRKSIGRIALHVRLGRVSGLQKFINNAPWRSSDVQRAIQAVFAERVVQADGGRSHWGGENGVLGVLCITGFTKKGSGSAGVGRQRNPRTGRVENCQIGAFLIGVERAGAALLDHRLYLHPSWFVGTTNARLRREKVHIPEGATYATLPEIAGRMIHDVTIRQAVPLRWIVASEFLATGDELVRELDACGLASVMGVLPDEKVWTLAGGGEVAARGAGCRSAAEIAADLSPWAWRPGNGDMTPASDFAALRSHRATTGGRGPEAWLLLRRPTTGVEPPVQAYTSAAPGSTPPEVLARVAHSSEIAAAVIEDARVLLGMAQYETRSWVGWHHHMSLVALAHLLATLATYELTNGREH